MKTVNFPAAYVIVMQFHWYDICDRRIGKKDER